MSVEERARAKGLEINNVFHLLHTNRTRFQSLRLQRKANTNPNTTEGRSFNSLVFVSNFRFDIYKMSNRNSFVPDKGMLDNCPLPRSMWNVRRKADGKKPHDAEIKQKQF